MYFLHEFRHLHEHSQLKFHAYGRIYAFSPFFLSIYFA